MLYQDRRHISRTAGVYKRQAKHAVPKVWVACQFNVSHDGVEVDETDQKEARRYLTETQYMK